MTDAKVKKAADKAHALDEASQTLRISAKRKWNKAIISCVIAFFILFSTGVIGLMYQNHYALQSKRHIDCIIKDLATPPPPGSSPNARKYIDIRSTLSSDCNIKFTQQ